MSDNWHEHDLKIQGLQLQQDTMDKKMVDHMEHDESEIGKLNDKVDAVNTKVSKLMTAVALNQHENKSLRVQIIVAVTAIVTLVGVIQTGLTIYMLLDKV